MTGFLKPVPHFIHKHTRACIITNGGHPVDYDFDWDWEGKPEDDLAAFPSFHDLLENDENSDPNANDTGSGGLPHKVRVVE